MFKQIFPYLQRLLHHSVFPIIREQMEYPDMIVLVLPTLISMIEHSTDEEYISIIQPEFKKIYTMQRPVQVKQQGGQYNV